MNSTAHRSPWARPWARATATALIQCTRYPRGPFWTRTAILRTNHARRQPSDRPRERLASSSYDPDMAPLEETGPGCGSVGIVRTMVHRNLSRSKFSRGSTSAELNRIAPNRRLSYRRFHRRCHPPRRRQCLGMPDLRLPACHHLQRIGSADSAAMGPLTSDTDLVRRRGRVREMMKSVFVAHDHMASSREEAAASALYDAFMHPWSSAVATG